MSHLDIGKESEPYDLFVFAINADQTREKYVTRLKKFFEIIGIDQEMKLSIQFCLEESVNPFGASAWPAEYKENCCCRN